MDRLQHYVELTYILMWFVTSIHVVHLCLNFDEPLKRLRESLHALAFYVFGGPVAFAYFLYILHKEFWS
jgi:hypothetical protein